MNQPSITLALAGSLLFRSDAQLVRGSVLPAGLHYSDALPSRELPGVDSGLLARSTILVQQMYRVLNLYVLLQPGASLPTDQELASLRNSLMKAPSVVHLCLSDAPGDLKSLRAIFRQAFRRRPIISWQQGNEVIVDGAWPQRAFCRSMLQRLVGRGEDWAKEQAHNNSANPLSDVRPYATWALFILLIAVFAYELSLGNADLAAMIFNPAALVLSALGGSSGFQVLTLGEYYRVLSATLLHSGALHLLMNCLALFMAGRLVEQMLNARAMLVIYFLSALGGSAASVLFHDPEVIAVGASGAILGLFGAGVALAKQLPAYQRVRVQTALLQSAVPALLPVASGIDYAAHGGGFVVGYLVAFLFGGALAKPEAQAAKAPMFVLIALFSWGFLTAVQRAVPDAAVATQVVLLVKEGKATPAQYNRLQEIAAGAQQPWVASTAAAVLLNGQVEGEEALNSKGKAVAMKLLEPLSTRWPSFEGVQVEWCRALLMAERMDEALAACAAVHIRFSANLDGVRLHGLALIQLKRYAEALPIFEKLKQEQAGEFRDIEILQGLREELARQ